MRRLVPIALLCALFGIALPPGKRAFALFASLRPWKADSPQKVLDHVPPPPPAVHVDRITRGRNPDRRISDRVWTWTEDADRGTIAIAVRDGGDRTPAIDFGYRMRLVAGALPEGLELPPPVLALPGGPGTKRIIGLHWLDWRSDQPVHCCAFRFALLVTCLDRGGNESAPLDTLWIEAPAR